MHGILETYYLDYLDIQFKIVLTDHNYWPHQNQDYWEIDSTIDQDEIFNIDTVKQFRTKENAIKYLKQQVNKSIKHKYMQITNQTKGTTCVE